MNKCPACGYHAVFWNDYYEIVDGQVNHFSSESGIGWEKMSMNKEEAKIEVSGILRKVLDHDPVYWHGNVFIRWGRIEIDILKIIDGIVMDGPTTDPGTVESKTSPDSVAGEVEV